MRYAAVATPSWLLLVDLQARQVQPLEFTRTEYYGISWFPDSDELVLSHSGLNNSDLIDVPSYAQSEKGCLSHGSLESRPFLSAPHQIICAPDNRVVCSNTGRNVISVFDFAQPKVFQEAGISDARWDRLALDQVTGDHLNSVFLHEDRLYVIAHGHAKGSNLATFSYPALDLINVEPLGNRTGLHNVWITSEGQRISCDSENGGVVDLDSMTPIWESGNRIYTRGLAASENFVLVGESQRSSRALRGSSMSGIWIIDQKTWRAIDYLCLGPYGNVNEVRLLDVPDLAHHGKKFTGLPKLLERNVFRGFSEERLNTAINAIESRRLWSDFEFIFGAPLMKDKSAKYAALDQLCLCTKKHGAELSFAYELENKTGAHVSAVLGYEGVSDDRNMTAILLQPKQNTAEASVWRHDGKKWICLTDLDPVEVPIAGDLRLLTTDANASLMIDDREIMTLQAEAVGLDRCNEGLGIRWMGATIRLIDKAA